jgi:hypothetical protein
LQPIRLMRRLSAALTVAMLVTAPLAGSAQTRLGIPSARVDTTLRSGPAVPIVSVAPVTIADEDASEPVERAAERLAERLRPLEQRLRDDDRIRRAGTVVGIGAIALGALRGAKPLTFAGTHALRLGLHKQLAAIETRSGFAVEPSIGHRAVAVTVRRTFD